MRSPSEARAAADAEPFLNGPVFLAVLLSRPDERPSNDRERDDAHGDDHYPDEGAHRSIVAALFTDGEDSGLGQCSE